MPPEVAHDVDLRDATAALDHDRRRLRHAARRRRAALHPGRSAPAWARSSSSRSCWTKRRCATPCCASRSTSCCSRWSSPASRRCWSISSCMRMIVRPVRRLTSSIVALSAAIPRTRRASSSRPAARTRSASPSARSPRCRAASPSELRQKKHLAALGLAVSKINHDLRNMLSSAQLFSDRLSALRRPDRAAARAPLIATLDRAIGFCQSTLAYGRAVETPARAPAASLLRALVEEAAATARPWPTSAGVGFENAVPPGLICRRRSRAALAHAAEPRPQRHAGAAASRPRRPACAIRGFRHAARRRSSIEVTDNGPGVPGPRPREACSRPSRAPPAPAAPASASPSRPNSPACTTAPCARRRRPRRGVPDHAAEARVSSRKGVMPSQRLAVIASQRRSNPAKSPALGWIASLSLAMTGRVSPACRSTTPRRHPRRPAQQVGRGSRAKALTPGSLPGASRRRG